MRQLDVDQGGKMGRLEGKQALVTGAGSGIGRAIALVFGQEGADVAIVELANTDGAMEVAEQLRAMGRDALVMQGDVSEATDVERTVSETLGRRGRIDILVNNAGIGGGYVP